jgi:hypothetical protein
MTDDRSPKAGAQPGARALASRRNGARSRGPRTAAGLARSSGNALKHGLRARRHVLLADEDAAEYRAFQAAAREELAPEGALQSELAARIVTTAWRARRADRLEAALLGRYLGAAALQAGDPQEALGIGLVRDGNGPRALETLVRYRGSVLAELFRTLAALKLLQADAREVPERDAPDAAPAILPRPRATTKRTRGVPANQPLSLQDTP